VAGSGQAGLTEQLKGRDIARQPMLAATISIVDNEARWSRPQDAAELAVQIMVARAREHLELVLTG